MKVIDHERFIYRWATIADMEQAAQTMKAANENNEEMGEWVRMMMDGRHASAAAGTVAIAEDRENGRIASVITTCPQNWQYAGIELRALNITEVGTHPDYQGQGHVNALMGMIHSELAENAAYDFSLVWGIPWFYTRFGYVQTLASKASVAYARTGILARWGEGCPYTIRPFEQQDIPFAVELHQHSANDSLVSFPYDANYWQMFVFDYFESNRDQYRVIEQDGRRIGVFVHYTFCDRGIGSYMFDLVSGISWLEVLPWVTGYLLDYGDKQLAAEGRSIEWVRYSLRQGHPVYEIMKDCYSRERQPEKNYYRITDMRQFLLRIAPVLEKRIAESFLCGYTRIVTLQLFGLERVLHIEFSSGRIADIAWIPAEHRFHDLHMPVDTFMQLLFGQQGIEDYTADYREVGSWNDDPGIDNEMRMLFVILFPVMPSHINHPL